MEPPERREEEKLGGRKDGSLKLDRVRAGEGEERRQNRSPNRVMCCKILLEKLRKTPTCQNLPCVLVAGTPVIYVNGPADKARPCHVWFHVGLLSHISHPLSFSVGIVYFTCLEISGGK